MAIGKAYVNSPQTTTYKLCLPFTYQNTNYYIEIQQYHDNYYLSHVVSKGRW